MNWFKKFWKGLTEPKPKKPTTAEIAERQKQSALKEPAPGKEATTEALSNFTPRAQQVLSLGRKEADRLHHNFLGTEHVLLGLIKLGQGVAVNVLVKLGLDLETVRAEVEKQVGTGPDQKIIGNIPYTPRVKKVVALAQQEARKLNHTYVGTEHLLLGLLREGDGVAAKVMKSLGVDLEKARQEILRELDPNYSPPAGDQSENPTSEESSNVRPRFNFPSKATIATGFPEPDKPKSDSVDTSKRYDVYCSERNQEVVVYRNALFKGVKRLLETRQYVFASEFIELEQADGQTIFLSKISIIKFCELGVTPGAESISNQKPE